MIETTSVDDPTKDFSIVPASRNICGFSATTSVATSPTSLGEGLRRTPFVASALISSDGYGSITATHFASRPPASQPVSIAPPILPAPARTMVPLIFEGVAVSDGATDNISRRPGEGRDP